jgi:1,4-alpha-glucan branching enzyme
MFGQSGKKLIFMGSEFGQWNEWYHEVSLDWSLLDYPSHAGVQRWLADLNRVYREQPALHEIDFNWTGFEWIDCNDVDASVLTFLRRGSRPEDVILVACNFTPVPRLSYRVGVPGGGFWQELLNSDAQEYGGSGLGNAGGLNADPWPHHGRPFSLSLTLPPLAVVFLKPAD